MDDLQSEKEQIEEIRAWWSEYYLVIIAGIAVAVGGMLGFNYYKDAKLAAQVAASELFETLAEHVGNGDLDAAEAVASELVTEFPSTPYAANSRLAMARLYMDQNRDQDAVDMLEELLGMSSGEDLQGVARLRLARVLLYQEKAQEVVDLLSTVDEPGFAELYDEVLGDAHAALGDYASAAEAYGRAMADPASSTVIDRALIQMKLVDLPEVVATVAEDAVTEDAVTEDGVTE
ncbi:MAG: tetratricopeptide repeat protein [Proteobacteria bacterium]|nr:tetratricopeptide repeat protein [Pseudomonadota bacterium]